MKLLYLHTGALETRRANVIQVLQMCRAFADLGVEIGLHIASNLADRTAAGKIIKEILVADTIPFEYVLSRTFPLSPKIDSVYQAIKFRKYCANTPHDLVFVRNPICLPIVCHSARRIIFESHNNLCVLNAPMLDHFLRKRVVKLSCAGNVALFIGISAALANWWQRQGVPEEKLCALHDAVDPRIFALDLGKSAARTATGLPDDRPIVLYAGSLYKDRNIADILRLASYRTDTRFVIVGGPEKSKRPLEKQAREMGLKNVIFTGPAPYAAVPKYLAAADILLMLWSKDVPTINYCSPLKVFEYMAAGRIIIGHRFPTIAEVIDDGKQAYLVDPDSFEELKDRLKIALDHPDQEMEKAAKTRVLARYTWQKRCADILALLSAQQR